MTFMTDDDDAEVALNIADSMADMNESNKIPGGTVGFSLDNTQLPCT